METFIEPKELVINPGFEKQRRITLAELSVGMIDKVVGKLLTSYAPTTPIAVVQRATWEDELIIIGTLENIAEKVKEAKITKTAQILVGDFIDCDYGLSKLYDKSFTHEYRQGTKG